MSKKVILKKGKDQPVRRFHPGSFLVLFRKKDKGVRDGDIVEVRDAQNEFLAVGHYQNTSIAIRIFSFEPITDRQNIWKSKLEKAFTLRQTLGLTDNPQTNCYRLVHAEGDGMPGLIIDIYNQTAVIQCHSIGMYKALEHLAKAIKEIYGEKIKAIYSKSEATLPSDFAVDKEDGYLLGDGSHCPAIVNENGIQFEVNWEEGQKRASF